MSRQLSKCAGGGGADRDDFGVSRRITKPFGLVVTTSDDTVVLDDYGSNRDFVFLEGLLGFLQGEAHEVLGAFEVEWESIGHGRLPPVSRISSTTSRAAVKSA